MAEEFKELIKKNINVIILFIILIFMLELLIFDANYEEVDSLSWFLIFLAYFLGFFSNKKIEEK